MDNIQFKHRIEDRYTIAVQPHTTMFSAQPGETFSISFGVAYCHKKDRFNKSIGRSISSLAIEGCTGYVVKKELTEFVTIIKTIIKYYDDFFEVVFHLNNKKGSIYLGSVGLL